MRASLAVVTMLMAKKTARRARSYLRAYRNPDAVSYSLIEKFVNPSRGVVILYNRPSKSASATRAAAAGAPRIARRWS